MGPLPLLLVGLVIYALTRKGGFMSQLPPLSPRKLTAAEEKRIGKLVPEVQIKVRELIVKTAANGVQLFVGSTDRTPAEQLEKIRQGRSGATQSWHLAARAADIYVIDPKTGQPDTSGKLTELYTVMGRTAESLGFKWLGTGLIKTKLASYTDPNHVEFRGGMTWASAMASIGRSPTPVRVA